MSISKEPFKQKAADGISLIIGGSGVLWVGTFTRGLFLIDKADLSVERITGLPFCRVNDILVEGRKAWVATGAGLFLVEQPQDEYRNEK
jgi:ligand-binding sensor domain-containing protein